VQRVVLLVRHPFDAIWSEYQRRQTGGNSHAEQVYKKAQWSERNSLCSDYLERKRAYNSYSYRLLGLFLCFLGNFLSHNFFLSLLLAPIDPLLTCLSARVCIYARVYLFLAYRCRKCRPAISKGLLHVWPANGSSICSNMCTWLPIRGHCSLPLL